MNHAAFTRPDPIREGFFSAPAVGRIHAKSPGGQPCAHTHTHTQNTPISQTHSAAPIADLNRPGRSVTFSYSHSAHIFFSPFPLPQTLPPGQNIPPPPPGNHPLAGWHATTTGSDVLPLLTAIFFFFFFFF